MDPGKRVGDGRCAGPHHATPRRGSVVKPATHSLNDLFGGDVRYLVPLYQRPYVWQRKTHWEPLWQDIVSVLEHHLDGDISSRGHFLGAVVLEQEPTHPGEVERRLVIDGQQRLTTLQLLLSAAAEQAGADGADRETRLLRRLIENDPDLTAGIQRFKVWPTNANRDDFVAAMAGGRPSRVDGDVVNTIAEAHEYFRSSIKAWVREGAPSAEERARRYEALRVALTSLLHVVSINLEPGDNAQVIFETLNARGTPLLAMDLVKNAVFHRAEHEQAGGTDELHHRVWEPELGRTYWREVQRQGRLNRPRAELFLMHWLTMRLKDVTPATELFPAFRGRVLDTSGAPPVAELIRELCQDAAIMRSFDEQPATSEEGTFFRRLAVLDTTTILPLVLLLFRSEEVTPECRRKALAVLESWLVRRMLCGLSPRNYNKLVVQLLELAWDNLDAVDEAIASALDRMDFPTTRWPRDNELSQALTSRGVYGYIAQRRLVMVLAAVERRRREGAKTESILDPEEKLSIEHIMPQEWSHHWPLAEGVDPLAAEAERNALLHVIGNLTVVTSPLNASLSNSPWQAKRVALSDHSLLLLNSELAKRDSWDDRAICERSAALAREICAIWQPPPTDRGLPASQTVPSAGRKVYSWTIADLVAAGKLVPGEILRPAPRKYATTAVVGDDGTLEIEGEVFQSPSSAAKRVTGNVADAGWNFWCAERDGQQVMLFTLREEMGAES